MTISKPKFKVGQMVVLHGPNEATDYGRRVMSVEWRDTWRYKITGAYANDGGFLAIELRSLTRKEAGLAPKKRKSGMNR